MATKPGRLVTYNEELPSIKLYDPLITWFSDFDFSYSIGGFRTQTPKSSPTSYCVSVKRFGIACVLLLFVFLLVFSRLSGNSEQKIILQTIEQLIQFSYLFLKGNFSGLFFFRTSRSEGEFPKGYLIKTVTCLFAHY